MVTEQGSPPTVLFFCGFQPHHMALRAKLEDVVPLAATVLRQQKRQSVVQKTWNSSGRAVTRGLFGFNLRQGWQAMLGHFERSRRPAKGPSMVVNDVNDARVIALVERLRPALVIVSGTNLLRPDLISAIRQTGVIINLHTGISPWVKGAPNCTNWCLANREFGLIGNTVHWLDEGIDSGNIITTERTPLSGNEHLDLLHRSEVTHGHDLLLRVVARHVQGEVLASVPQSELGAGRLYLQRQWTGWTALKAIFSFHHLYRPASKNAGLTEATRLVPLDRSVV